MSDNKTFYILIGLTLMVIGSYIDSLYIYPRMINSSREMEYICKNYPKECWIKENKHGK